MMQQFYGLASRRVLLGLLICLFMATASPAADLYWNAPDGGTGPWNLTDILWSLDNLTNTVAWTDGDNAIFGGTSSGTVTIATGGVGAGSLTFNRDGYTIDGDTLTLSGIPTLTVTNAGDTATISASVVYPAGADTDIFTKAGAGKLVINSTASAIDGVIAVTQGELVYSGMHTNAVAEDAVGNTSGQNGILTLASGAVFNSNYNNGGWVSSMNVGGGGGTGSLRVQDGATFYTDAQLGVGNGGFGTYTQTGGSATVGGFLAVGLWGSSGVFNQSGGTFTKPSWPVTIGNAGGSIGVMNLSGTASFTQNATDSPGSFWISEGYSGGDSLGILNMSDSATLSVPNTGIRVGLAGSAVGMINLMGGTVATQRVLKDSGAGPSAEGTAYINFNGGTLKPTAASTNFMQDMVNSTSGLGGVFLYSGGAIIDTGGFDITIAEPLKAPTGSGVSATGLTFSGGGYLDAPAVRITNATGDTTGNGASAVANIDASGNLTGITITSPGMGYTAAPTFTLVGGGNGNTGAIGGAATLVANTSGGLTKTGSGTLTLTGASTYTGPTSVDGGTLAISGAGSIGPGAGAATITSSGAGILLISDTGTINATGITINGGAGSDLKLVQSGSTALSVPVTLTKGTVAGTTTIDSVTVGAGTGGIVSNGDGNGSTDILTINSLSFTGAGDITVYPASQYSQGLTVGTLSTVSGAGNKVAINAYNTSWFPGEFYLVNYTTAGGTGGLGAFEKGTIYNLTNRQSATLSTATSHYISLLIAGDNPVWTGYDENTSSVDGNWTTSTSLKNWKLITEGTPTYYIEGDTSRFDDGAIGTTTVSISNADVSPSTVLFANSYLDYTIDGPYGIAGAGNLVLNSSGSVTLNTNNSYTGGTTVSLGTLTLAGANTTTGATTLNSGTLNINNNNALGIGALRINGGTIDNTSGALITLATTNVMNWNADFAFGGTNDLDLGVQNNVALPATRSITANDPMSTGAKLIVRGVISGSGFGINKRGTGKMVLYGVNTYTGVTTVDNGTLEIAGGSIGVAASTAPNIQITPDSSLGTGTLLVSDGTVYADRVIIGGNTGNSGTPGSATLTQTGGTIYSREWFTVGSGIGAGGVALTGIYDMSGGTMILTGQNMEVGNFGATTGIVNISGSAAIKIWNNRPINVGANDNCTAGTINQNGGTVTFYSDAGTTVGGTGSLNLGTAGTSNGIFEYYLNGGTLTVPTISRNSSATNSSQGNFYFNGGTLKAARSNTNWMGNLLSGAVMIMDDGAYIDSNGFNVTINQALWGSGKLVKQGNGSLTLAGSNSYAGDTEVTGGTLILSATGDITGSLGITINGSGAKLVQANTTSALYPTVTVQTGTLDGTGTVNTAVVSDGTGGIIANGNGTAGALTIGSLTFNGVGAMNLITATGTPTTPVLVVTNLTTSGKTVTVNATAPTWSSGQVYDLVSYSALTGSFNDFTKGTVANLNARQTATLTNPAGYIALSIAGVDYIKWSGAENGDWTTDTIPSPKNWLLSGSTETDFLTNDSVVFDDSATGSTAVEILNANVSPIATKFDNSAKNYTVSSTAGYGIASGLLVKSGTGELTINTANTYAGGTTLNAGKLNLNNASAIGTGVLTINGGTIDNTSGAAVTLSTNNAQSWNGDFTFAGTNNLSLGTGAATLTGNRQVTVSAGTLSVGSIPATAGLYNLTKAGAGALNLSSSTNNATTISGTLNVSAGEILVHADVTVNGLAGAGTIRNANADSSGNDKWFFVNNATDNTFDGIITGGVNNKLGLSKNGLGTLTLTNAGNVINDQVTVRAGTLVFAGTHNNTTQTDTVGDLANANAILKFAPGTTFGAHWSRNGWESSMNIGTNSTAAASVRLNDSTSALDVTSQLAIGSGGYGAFTQTAGTTAIGGFIALGGNSNGGVLNLSGGTITKTAYSSTVGYGWTNSVALLNLSGTGVFNTTTWPWGDGLWIGENGSARAVLNVSGNALCNIRTNDGVTDINDGGLWLGKGDSASGQVNLLGGTIITPYVVKGTAETTTGIFNFNGGTLKAHTTVAPAFMSNLTAAYVYPDGAIIDTNGQNVNIAQSLLAPTGNGVSSAGMDLGSGGVSGTGFIDTPIVVITGDGVGATAVANIDYATGDLLSITMTNPGVDYTAPPTFSLLGGGRNNTGAILAAPTLVANTSGGLTKNGAGTLTLSGTNTYGGNTVINGGTLLATYTASLPGYSTADMVQVASGATVAASVGGAGQWLADDVLALNTNATLPAGSFLGMDTTGGDFTYSYAITGSEGFKKMGTNKLTLGAVNTYAGPTVINGGILSIDNNDKLGDAAGGLTFNGGKLAATGAVTMARPVAINAAGSGIDTAGNIVEIGGDKDLTWAAVTLTVDGTTGGKLLFNRTGGTTTITSGAILQINAGASVELTGTPSTSDATNFVNIVNNSALSVTGITPQAAGAISGAGTTTLASSSSMTVTSIVQDTLTIGAGAKLTIAPITGGSLAGLSTLSAVPEPSTWALLLLAGLGLGIYWRRSR
jgi:autotransporter-associated beta strand protein